VNFGGADALDISDESGREISYRKRAAGLVAAAYERHGTRCVDYFSGEFTFAIWDELLSRLFIAQDPVASRPMCFWQDAAKFAFSNDPRILLGFPSIPRVLNRRKLAGMAVPLGMDCFDHETLHSGIMSLGAATCLSIDARGMHEWTYWTPGESSVHVPTRPADALAELRDLLIQSVQNRIRTKTSVTSLLSGGLDSSALTAIAARCLEKRNRSLVAISSVLPVGEHSAQTDEREFIDEFRSWPNIHIEYVTAPGCGPFDLIEKPAITQASFLHTSFHYLYEGFAEVACKHAADITLDGFGGELGPTTRGTRYSLELAAGLHWRRLVSNSRYFSPESGLTPPGIKRPSLLRTLAREGLEMVRPWRKWKGGPLLTAAFRTSCDAYPPAGRYWPNHRTRQIDTLRRKLRKHSNHVWDAALRLPLSTPFLDRRVLEFCIAAPGYLKSGGGYSRCLIRGALDGILPPKIQWRTTKKPFSPDYYVRYNAQLPKAIEFISAIRQNDPVRSIVDVEGIARIIRPIDPSVGNYDALSRIPSSVYLICFLRSFPEFRL